MCVRPQSEACRTELRSGLRCPEDSKDLLSGDLTARCPRSKTQRGDSFLRVFILGANREPSFLSAFTLKGRGHVPWTRIPPAQGPRVRVATAFPPPRGRVLDLLCPQSHTGHIYNSLSFSPDKNVREV